MTNNPPLLMTVEHVLTQAERELGQIEDRALIVRTLLSHVMDKPASWIMAHPEAVLSEHQLGVYIKLIARAAHHEPLAYITGHREFYGRNFLVSPFTLIPRPETELLLEYIFMQFPDQNTAISMVDVGTGSGNIAISAAIERPGWQIWATDVSVEALKVARTNAERLGATDVSFAYGSLLEPLPSSLKGKIEVIAANLPYISDDEFEQLPETVRDFEPELALRSGLEADTLNNELKVQAKDWLTPDGWLIYETTNGQIVPLPASQL